MDKYKLEAGAFMVRHYPYTENKELENVIERNIAEALQEHDAQREKETPADTTAVKGQTDGYVEQDAPESETDKEAFEKWNKNIPIYPTCCPECRRSAWHAALAWERGKK